jgi:ATP-dependent DNA helicase RecQ
MQATKNAQVLLKKYFGYESFRPHQEEIIDCLIQQKDCLALMPTGGGKSICFQLPALMLPGITLVISPLIALMKDQVGALKTNGIAAEFLNSSISQNQQDEIFEQMVQQKIKLLYLSPERLLSQIDHFKNYLNPTLIAIDEAHCISQWGHDFRPEYTQLAQIRQIWPNTPVAAFTATADKTTRKDIANQLKLRDPKLVVASFDRPNLSLEVRFGIKKKKKIEEITAFIKKRKAESGIIYCLSRKSTEEMATELQLNGIQAGFYHAGIDSEERSRIQDDFSNDRIKVMCATIAFGMGIDKSNVRFVIHSNMPKNMEGFYQEIGRAGRDGLPSDTVLYFNLGDLVMLKNFNEDSAQKELNNEKLNRMVQYAEASICRRIILLAYFGETMNTPCGNCDVCKEPRSTFDGSILVQKALSGIMRTEEKIGLNLLIDLLRESHRKELIELKYNQLKTFGAGKDLSFAQWQQYLLQMLNRGLFDIAYDEGYALKVSSFGKEVLMGMKKVDLVHLEDLKPYEPIKKKALPYEIVEESNNSLFDYLRGVRRQFAEKENVPAYIVLSDATLKELAKQKPINLSDLLHIDGFGEFKIKKYGNTFVKEIKNWVRANETPTVKIDTYTQTLQLIKNGYSIQEISEQRSLHETTIYSHLAQLYSKGEIESLEAYVSNNDVNLVKEAVKQTQEKKLLAPLFAYLNEEIPFHVIRLCLAIIQKEEREEN